MTTSSEEMLTRISAEIVSYDLLDQNVECIGRMKEHVHGTTDKSVLEVCYIAIANCSYAIGDHKEALSAIAKYDALQGNPSHDIYKDMVKIRVYVAGGEFDKAKTLLDFYLSKSESLSRDHRDIFYEMNGHYGRILMQNGQYDLAVIHLNLHLQYLNSLNDPEYTVFWREDLLIDLGYCLDEIGDVGEAESVFNSVIKLGGGKRQADALYYLGVIHLKMGDPHQAIKDFRMALSRSTDDFDRTHTILLAESRAHEATQDFEAANDCKRRAGNRIQ